MKTQRTNLLTYYALLLANELQWIIQSLPSALTRFPSWTRRSEHLEAIPAPCRHSGLGSSLIPMTRLLCLTMSSQENTTRVRQDSMANTAEVHYSMRVLDLLCKAHPRIDEGLSGNHRVCQIGGNCCILFYHLTYLTYLSLAPPFLISGR